MKKGNRFFLTATLLTVSVLVAGTAQAAPKAVLVKKLNLFATTQGAEGLLLSGKTVITYANTEGPNTNILLTGFDATGQQIWQKTLDSGLDEIATAGATDSAGNIWLAGSSSVAAPVDTSTPVVATDNPDAVVVEAPVQIRPDISSITLWKISPVGDQISRFSSAMSTPVLINALSVNSSGVSVVGSMSEKPFVATSTLAGVFTKPVYIGTSKTELNAVARATDGSVNVFGSSSETLGGKKVAGARDGVLIKLSKALKITNVVRSSANKADRSWLSADSSLALTGSVRVGKTVESAITKFTPAFAPTWTQRVVSNGSSYISTVANAKLLTTYVAIGSTGQVSGINGWRPTSLSTLLLVIDPKGVTTAAYGAPAIGAPIAIASSKDAGIFTLVRANDQSVAIYRLPIVG